MHNGDANFKTLALRICNLEQNVKRIYFVQRITHSSSMYNMYVQYVQYVRNPVRSDVQITYFSEH